MKAISVSLVLSLFLFSCRAEQIQPPKEFLDFTNMLIDEAGKPVFTHVETMQGKDSVTVAVFVYEAEINWQEIDKNGKKLTRMGCILSLKKKAQMIPQHIGSDQPFGIDFVTTTNI